MGYLLYLHHHIENSVVYEDTLESCRRYFGGVISKNTVFDIFQVIDNVRYWQMCCFGKKMDASNGLWGDI